MRLLAVIPLALGVLTLGVAIMAYVQLQTMAALPQAPNLDDYPVVKWIASDILDPPANAQQPPPKPVELAQQTMQRIWTIGFVGAVLAVFGLLLGVVAPRRAKSIGV